MKHIIVFGAGKSAIYTIEYLLKEAAAQQWHITVADINLHAAQSSTGRSAHATAVCLHVENDDQRSALIRSGDVVISLLPPALHFLVAKDCVTYGRHLLTASYVDDNIRALAPEIKAKNLLFIGEMGLDPGIDHMSAMKLIRGIKNEGGKIMAFMSHCGGLVSPENDDNPWHYKISWNPKSVVRAGSTGARYKLDHAIVQKPYDGLFDHCPSVYIEGLDRLAYYPNRDSLHYMALYGLDDAQTFIRTTLRYPAFCTGWNCIVRAGLTDDIQPVAAGMRLKKWSEGILPYVNNDNKSLLAYLGLFDDQPVPARCNTSAGVLQHLLETKLALHAGERDLIVMQHDITYERHGEMLVASSTLVVKGEDDVHTAMAKTVGLPLGIAARLILQNKITLTGLHIPVLEEIYVPVLQELAAHSIVFKEKLVKMQVSGERQQALGRRQE